MKNGKYLIRIRLTTMMFLIFTLHQISLQAQVTLTGTNYFENFNNLSPGISNGWTIDTGMTTSFLGNDVSTTYFNNTPATNTGWSNTTGRFKNVASGTPYTFFADATSASQLAQSDRALGIRQNAALDKNAGFVVKLANTTGFNNFTLSFNLQSLDSNASRTTTWMVDYGIGNNPASFTPAATAGIMTTGGNQFSKETITVDFGNALDNKSQPVYIRIVSVIPTTGTGNRTTSAIDNFNLSWSIMPPPSNMELLAKTPADTAVLLSTNQLTLRYDNLIQPGSGQIDLYKAGNLIPISFIVPSAIVTINDSTATINGVGLENNTSYHVLMPAGTFIKQGDTLSNHAITDSTYWTFSTIDTTPPPAPVLPSMLNESFLNCSDTAIGAFVQYNVSGAKTWKCTVNGHDDSAAVSMSGGLAVAVSNTNEDWLISAELYDFSGMTKPVLSFWQKSRFEGTVTRTIKISTNYISGTIPDSATWTILQVQDMSYRPDADIWSQVTGIDLTDFKSTPFFLAFTYACDTGGAYELSYDDIKVTDNPLNIVSPQKENIDFKVLGEATSEGIILDFNLFSNAGLNIRMYDMTGRIVFCRQNAKGKAGHQQILMENSNIHTGLYIIKVQTNDSFGAIKVMVK
jgi:hypothetical protein